MKKIVIIFLSLILFSCEKNIENQKNNGTGKIEKKVDILGKTEEEFILYDKNFLDLDEEIKNKYLVFYDGVYLKEDKFKEVPNKDFIGGINFDLYGKKIECLENEKKYISKIHNFTNCLSKDYVAYDEIGSPFHEVKDGSSIFTKGEIYSYPIKKEDIFSFKKNYILFRNFVDFLINDNYKYFLKLERNGNYYSIDIYDENKKYLRTNLIMKKISKSDFLKNEKYFSIIFDKNDHDNRRFLETMRILEK